MLGLPPHRRFPANPEPGEILVDRGLEFRPAARRIDILDAQQEAATAAAREIEIQQRRAGVAEMEVAVRARCKSENGWRHDGGLVMPGHSRSKDGVASARLCPGHPRLFLHEARTWMPGTRPGMTSLDKHHSLN